MLKNILVVYVEKKEGCLNKHSLLVLATAWIIKEINLTSLSVCTKAMRSLIQM